MPSAELALHIPPARPTAPTVRVAASQVVLGEDHEILGDAHQSPVVFKDVADQALDQRDHGQSARSGPSAPLSAHAKHTPTNWCFIGSQRMKCSTSGVISTRQKTQAHALRQHVGHATPALEGLARTISTATASTGSGSPQQVHAVGCAIVMKGESLGSVRWVMNRMVARQAGGQRLNGMV